MNRCYTAVPASLKNASRLATRAYATAAATPTAAATDASVAQTSEGYLDIAKVPIQSAEVAFPTWTDNQKNAMIARLQELQKKDWKELTLQEKRAAFYVAFGPHSYRAPFSHPGDNLKAFLGVVGIVGLSGALFALIRKNADKPPPTMNPEWQEATNEYLREQNANPITGISSKGYQGKGMVTTSD
ncbi:cytochrome c oxidase [Dimargaris verticillata]|uniref:Cytochrome c oxidase n=1 Tax=Dimargaris verticillata TaxID=2761393 RepID=A0A9W8EDD2_9FUNG|nr:cytochrome c oxidase [Dimargaris verticillata]